tara:strand:+ start:2484 stop:3314 length:831 start_codon:yes stop_codon:yes gene_type:complete
MSVLNLTSLCPGGIYACAQVVTDKNVQDNFNKFGVWNFDAMVQAHLAPIKSNALYNEKNGWIVDMDKLREICNQWENHGAINDSIYILTNIAGVKVQHMTQMTEWQNTNRLVAKQGQYFEHDGYTVAFVDTQSAVKQAFVAHKTQRHQDAGKIAQVIRLHRDKAKRFDNAILCPEVNNDEVKVDILGKLVGISSQNGYTTGEATQNIKVSFDKHGSEATAVTVIIAYRSINNSRETTIDMTGDLSLMYYIDTENGPKFIMCVALPHYDADKAHVTT